MNKKTVKIVAIVIACLFLLGIAAPILGIFVFAAPADEKLREYEQEEKSAMEQMKEIEKKLNEAGERVYQTQLLLTETDKQLEEINKELAAAQEQKDAQMETYKKRVAAICETGGTSYMELLFSASSFSDFMDKLVLAKELAAYDKSILDSMESVQAEIESKKSEIEELKSGQESAKNEYESAMSDLYQQSADAAAYLESVQNDKAAYEQYLKEKEEEERQAKQRAGITYSNGSADVDKIPNGMFIWPTNASNITSAFSPNRVNPVTGVLRPHTGTDIGASYGAPIWAASGGTVTLAEYNGGYGNCVIINHGNGVSTLYGHMSTILVSRGDTVEQGTQIGRVGSTGNSTGPHLHFEVIIDGTAVDAMQFFD